METSHLSRYNYIYIPVMSEVTDNEQKEKEETREISKEIR
jgi:hypothetical protein